MPRRHHEKALYGSALPIVGRFAVESVIPAKVRAHQCMCDERVGEPASDQLSEVRQRQDSRSTQASFVGECAIGGKKELAASCSNWGKDDAKGRS